MDTGSIIRMHRRLQNRRQTDVARAVGRTAPWLCMIETGAREPTAQELRDLANALNLPITALTGGMRSSKGGQ
jgi:transcriptional regulator with XRE-family HTH domain